MSFDYSTHLLHCIILGLKNLLGREKPLTQDQVQELYWESTYAIALALLEHYPHLQPEQTGLQEMEKMITRLPGFRDDPALATNRILMDIQITWFEEATTL